MPRWIQQLPVDRSVNQRASSPLSCFAGGQKWPPGWEALAQEHTGPLWDEVHHGGEKALAAGLPQRPCQPAAPWPWQQAPRGHLGAFLSNDDKNTTNFAMVMVWRGNRKKQGKIVNGVFAEGRNSTERSALHNKYLLSSRKANHLPPILLLGWKWYWWDFQKHSVFANSFPSVANEICHCHKKDSPLLLWENC